MNSFWRFLRDKRNQQVLGWFGGGLVVAVTGLWAVFVYFFPHPKAPDTTQPSEPHRPGKLWWDCHWPRCNWIDHHGGHHIQLGLRAETEVRRLR